MLRRGGLLGNANHESTEPQVVDAALAACRAVGLSRGRFDRIDERGRAQQELFADEVLVSRRRERCVGGWVQHAAGRKAHVCLPGSASPPACRGSASEIRPGNGPKAHVCLPGSASPPACRGSASPPACRGSASPPACRGSASPPACRGPASPPASRGRRLDGNDRQPLAPPPARPAATRNQARQTRALLPSGTSCRSEKNPPLTHGDPAEAGPPGQSQPSRVRPVKQQTGAMRTRTGAQPSSSSRASPIPWICAHLPTRSGGGRHPQTRPTSPPPCGIPRAKPPKWRSATPPRIPPRPAPARLLSCPSVQQPRRALRDILVFPIRGSARCAP
jgi:hypothetical protein